MIIFYNIIYFLKLLGFITAILQNVGQQVSADYHSPVIKYLPGFQGPLPFELTTGSVSLSTQLLFDFQVKDIRFDRATYICTS